MMNRTQRTIGLSAFVMLAVLGTGWALEKASGRSHTQGATSVSGPARPRGAVTTPLWREPVDAQPAGTDSSPEYDRSDLALSQG
ncbi:MAG: hypothetical protein DMD87_17985 [Candidatus Rokuibacteriota bacterium]|nr:MAG: hypothetical protein DMD87_17985 [Candidatus Rokubacteria bacterium]